MTYELRRGSGKTTSHATLDEARKAVSKEWPSAKLVDHESGCVSIEVAEMAEPEHPEHARVAILLERP